MVIVPAEEMRYIRTRSLTTSFGSVFRRDIFIMFEFL